MNRRIIPLFRRPEARAYFPLSSSSGPPVPPPDPQPIPFNQAYFVFDADGVDQFTSGSTVNAWTNEGYGFASSSWISGTLAVCSTDSIGKFIQSFNNTSYQLSTKLSVTSSNWTIVAIGQPLNMSFRYMMGFQSPSWNVVAGNVSLGTFDGAWKLWGDTSITPRPYLVTLNSSTSQMIAYVTGSQTAASPVTYSARTISSGSEVRLFSGFNGSANWQGKIYFFALYPWVFSQSERDQMDAWLEFRYPTLYGGS